MTFTRIVRLCLLLLGGLYFPGPAAAFPDLKELLKKPAEPKKAPGAVNDPLVIISPEQYQQLLKQLEELRQQQANQNATARPRQCEIVAKVEKRGQSTVVRLKVTFKFQTLVANTKVYLNCQRAQTVEAKLDDGTAPQLIANDDGISIRVEKAGDHRLTLDLDCQVVPRGPKGADLGFEIGLPTVPITLFSMEAIPGTKRVSIGTKTPRPGKGPLPVEETDNVDFDRLAPGRGGIALGPIADLAITWEDTQRQSSEPKTTDGEILVTATADELVTEARWRLRGSSREWRFVAPATADVSVSRWVPATAKSIDFPADRSPTLVRPEPGQNIWKIQFADTNSQEIALVIVARTPRPKAEQPKYKGPYNIGPLAMLDVPGQNGTLRIRAPFNIRATANLKGETKKESDDDASELVCRYGYTTPLKNPPGEPLLELFLNAIPGSITASVKGSLTLGDSAWRWRQEWILTPYRTEIDSIDIEIPPAFQLQAVQPRELIDGFTLNKDPGKERTTARIKLLKARRTPLTLSIEGVYSDASSQRPQALVLPRALGANARETDLEILAPQGIDIRAQGRPWENNKITQGSFPFEADRTAKVARWRLQLDRSLGQIDVEIVPVPITGYVTSQSEIDFNSQRASITQRLHYTFTGPAPSKLLLRSTGSIDRVKISPGNLIPIENGYEVQLPNRATKELTLTAVYYSELPDLGATAKLWAPPLLIPGDLECRYALRAWAPDDRALRLHRDEMAWAPSPLEATADREAYPDLALRGRNPSTGPMLVLASRQSDQRFSKAIIDRAQGVLMINNRDVNVRLRHTLNRSTTGIISFLIPETILDLEVSLNDKLIRPEQTRTEQGTIVNLPLPGTGATIEWRYRVTKSPWATIPTPTFAEASVDYDITWLVFTADQIIPVTTHANTAVDSFRSSLQGLYHVKLPASTQEQRALAQDLGVTVGSDERAFIWRHDDREALTLLLLPRYLWIALSSLVALFIGLSMRAAPPWAIRAFILCLCLTAVVLVEYNPVLFWVGFLSALPGVALWLLMVVVYRYTANRHRRRLATLPHFTRLGSTLVRPSAVRPRETTTIDALPPSNHRRSSAS